MTAVKEKRKKHESKDRELGPSHYKYVKILTPSVLRTLIEEEAPRRSNNSTAASFKLNAARTRGVQPH